MTLMKQLEEIAQEDFKKSPYWMFYSGRDGEFDASTTLISQDHPDYDKRTPRLISTRYTLNNGRILEGFLHEKAPHFYRHTIFVRNTGFETWFGFLPPSRDYIRCIYDMLNLGKDDVFPIRWESFGKEYSGTIKGFGYLSNGVKTEIR